jgi:hypothetical protein
MTLTNEQVASLDETSVLRVTRPHNLLGEEGKLVRYRPELASPFARQHDYVPVENLDGSRIDGSWFPNRFNLVDPEAITGSSSLPPGTLLRCIRSNSDNIAPRVTEGTFYRVLNHDPRNAFISVATLDGQPVNVPDSDSTYEFFTNRFAYYPDSAPAEPTTEKGTTMSNTTTLTREAARTLRTGARVVFTDGGERQGKTFILDRAGIDSDGDFHGSFEGSDYNHNHFLSYSYFSLPTDSPTPTEGTATELQALRVQRDAYKADLERVIDALREEAKGREWCSEYDRFMERLGFEARCTRKFTVRRRAYIEWDVEIEASDEDAAREEADNNEPSYVRDLDSDYLDLESIEIVDVEEA